LRASGNFHRGCRLQCAVIGKKVQFFPLRFVSEDVLTDKRGGAFRRITVLAYDQFLSGV
jgi:hypothetical protein